MSKSINTIMINGCEVIDVSDSGKLIILSDESTLKYNAVTVYKILCIEDNTWHNRKSLLDQYLRHKRFICRRCLSLGDKNPILW